LVSAIGGATFFAVRTMLREDFLEGGGAGDCRRTDAGTCGLHTAGRAQTQNTESSAAQFPTRLDIRALAARGHPVPVSAIGLVAQEMQDPIGTKFGSQPTRSPMAPT